MSLERVLEEARRELLAIPGVVAVSYRDGVIVVYVEDEAVSYLIPRSYRGYPVEVRVVGRIGLLW
jgi:hypothetical protein